MDDPPLGTIVTVPQGRGVIRFKGTTSFKATGKWIGIELYEKNGKNDGSVEGISYFRCEPGHGVFVRPSQIKTVHGSELDSRTGRPGAGHQRTPSSSSLLRSNSTRTSPPSVSGSSTRSASPAKPTAVQASLARSTAKPPPPSSSSPTKFASTPQRKPASRPSIDSPRNAFVTPVKQTGTARRTSSPLSLPPESVPPIQRAPTPPTPRALVIPQKAPGPHPDEAELIELRSKYRLMEAKRTEDARHIVELETRLAEAETFVSLRPKLQAKLNTLNNDLGVAKRELADAKRVAEMADNRVADAQEQLELMMLDKEVAEERAELAESELEDIKERLAILEVENDVLKAENSAPVEGVGKPDSLAYIQLEKQNERLKEALVKLRDITQETDQEQRKRIAEMEQDVADVENLRVMYEDVEGRLASAEHQIESLKEQLDDALQVEEMLVPLTERNLMLSEKIEEMRITIEDLEALKELSDELEENHTETEKQLNEDLNAKDAQIHAQQRRISELEESCADLENTINQFRELVQNLQSELDYLRSQTETAQSLSATANSQAAAVLSQNIKLQSSAIKNQARNIDLEMKRIESKEAREHLNIVWPYLPKVYLEADNEATKAYLFFQRLGAKADLINQIVAQIHNLPEALNGDVTDTMIGACELRGLLSGASTFCRRFAAVLKRCDGETFLKKGAVYARVAHFEEGIDKHIDALRRDELVFKECFKFVYGFRAELESLQPDFDGVDSDIVERELGYVFAADHDLDVYAAAFGTIKTSVAAILKEEDGAVMVDLGGLDPEETFFKPLMHISGRCTHVKATWKKLAKRLDDLNEKSSALNKPMEARLQSIANYVTRLYTLGIELAQDIISHIVDARQGKCSFQFKLIIGKFKQHVQDNVANDLKQDASPWEALGEAMSHVIEQSNALFPAVLEQENTIRVSGIAPWISRIQEIQATLAVNVEAERKVSTLNDEIQALARSLRSKDQFIQESSVRIEMMERRLEASKKQAEQIVNLEDQVAKFKKQEQMFEETTKQLDAEIDALYKQNEVLKSQTASQEAQPAAQQNEPDDMRMEGNLETWALLERIEALRGTVRFLRMENSYLKGQDLLREIEALPPLPVPTTRTPTPALDPSGASDTDSSSPSDSENDEERSPPVTLASLASETRRLYRDVIQYSTAPRVVDLSEINAKREESKTGRMWMPKRKTPAHKVWERKQEGERLNRRVNGLLARASAIGASL